MNWWDFILKNLLTFVKIEKFDRSELDLKLMELEILKELMEKYPNEISNIMGFKIENLDDLA